VIAWESGVVNTVDPFGGSYAVEALTDQIERDAASLIARIDAMGGTLVAIESGFIQREIQDAAYRAQQRIDSGESVVVGVNRYVTQEDHAIETLQIDPAIEGQQIERLRRVRALRDQSAWRSALDAVSAAARGADNLVPAIVGAVEAQATVGEISDAMRAVFGEHREIDV
jgi:methylmalonyl-CoA mutase N-terminal domain/subunit